MRALAPARRVYFLCSSKENRRKEKTPEALTGLRRSPAFLANSGVAHNSAIYGALPRKPPQTSARLFPGLAAVLGECYGRVTPGNMLYGFKIYPPVGAAEHRSENRMKLTLV